MTVAAMTARPSARLSGDGSTGCAPPKQKMPLPRKPTSTRQKATGVLTPRDAMPSLVEPLSSEVGGHSEFGDQAGDAPASLDPNSTGREATSCVSPIGTLPPAPVEPSSSRRKASTATAPKLAVPSRDEPSSSQDTANISVTPSGTPPDLTRTIAVIREKQRERADLLATEVALTLRIKSICRRYAGFNPDDDAKTKASKMKRADELYAAINAGEIGPTVGATMAIKLAREGVESERKGVEKMLAKAAETLPVFASFVGPLNGMGALGLGQIIGEAGDLAMYANPGKLWKRLGLAPVKGKAPSTWRKAGGLSAEEWTAAGYSPKRRSIMFVIGDSLLKKQNPYRELYLARKQYECEQFAAKGLPVLAEAEAKAQKAKPGTYTSAMYAHNRAKRYMEKRLLRDLWRAWRGQVGEPPLSAAMPRRERTTT